MNEYCNLALPVRRDLNQKQFRYAADVVNAARYNLDAPDDIPAGATVPIPGTGWVKQARVNREAKR